MRFTRFLVLTVAIFVLSACNNPSSFNPIAPSDASPSDIPWSPYIGIHPTGEASVGYREALGILKSHNRVQGIRVELFGDGSARELISMARSFGVEVVGILNNFDVVKPNPEKTFDDYVRLYPDVKVFQIGNEITSISPGPRPTIQQYMEALIKIGKHVGRNYPNITLVSQSVTASGGGFNGADELKEMVNLGLKDIFPNNPSRLVIGLNVYRSDSLSYLSSAITNHLGGGYRIWVMESGYNSWNGQIAHVYTAYPRIRDELRAERIYWYVLWNGDNGAEKDFSLIKNPSRLPLETSPLFKLLTDQK